ncbi:MAG: ABC transporter ATP-binding protein [Thermoproteota archaeon]
MSLLKLNEISVKYQLGKNDILALSNVSFSLYPKEILGILGESGSGKSTLALTVMRALPKNARIIGGEVIFNGKNLLNLSEDELNTIRWKKISIIPQNSMNSLSPVHKIRDQLRDILLLHEPKLDEKEAINIMKEKLRLANISEEVLDKFPHQLSGGMRQRILIAASLLCNPEIIIADEPTTGLDVVTQYQILKELKNLQSAVGFSMMIISHDISVISNTSHRIVVMYGGKVVEIGPSNLVVENPLHPYTQMLLEVQMEISKKTQNILHNRASFNKLHKSVDVNFVHYSSCPFVQRCPFAIEKCKTESPTLLKVNDERYVSCFLFSR